MSLSLEQFSKFYGSLKEHVLQKAYHLDQEEVLELTLDTEEGPVPFALSKDTLTMGEHTYKFTISAAIASFSITKLEAIEGVPRITISGFMFSKDFSLPESIPEVYGMRILDIIQKAMSGLSPITETEKIVTLTLEKI